MDLPLVLGGHSFIQQLGNEPAPSAPQAQQIVSECLDRGISWFDTTYQPERIALGTALKKRRAEAKIIAWNFFVPFKPGGETGGPDYYTPPRIDQLLRELQTDYIDLLIVHEIGDTKDPSTRDKNQQQFEQAREWKSSGQVKALGLWAPGVDAIKKHLKENPVQYLVSPHNVFAPKQARVFVAAKQRNWQTMATSPFGRGWDLDKLVKAALKSDAGDEKKVRAKLADAMLRHALFQPNIDRLIVAMRQKAWVKANAESAKRGALSPEEVKWLQAVVASSKAAV